MAASNVGNKGIAAVNGFKVEGMGPGNDLELITIEAIALKRQTNNKKDVAFITVKPKHMTNELGQELKRNQAKAKIAILY